MASGWAISVRPAPPTNPAYLCTVGSQRVLAADATSTAVASGTLIISYLVSGMPK